MRRAAFFVENRNGVHIADAVARALGDDWEAVFFTADASGTVAGWVKEAMAFVGREPAINVLAGARSAKVAADPAVVAAAASRWMADSHVSRLVLFNDQSTRGRAVVEAAADIPSVLIQDGTLEFDARAGGVGRGDPNSYYGTSGVDRVCVWGSHGARLLADRLGLRQPDIRVTGSVLHSADARLAHAYDHREAVRRAADAPSEPRVLILDQPLGDQGKTTAARHLDALTRLVKDLRRTAAVTIKPHPSSSTKHLGNLAELPATVLPATTPLTASLDDVDLAITWFSTAYLDTMRSEVPLVFIDDYGGDVVMPLIKSHLLRTATTVEEAVEVVAEFAVTGRFRANATGIMPDALVRINPRVAEDVAQAVMDEFSIPVTEPIRRETERSGVAVDQSRRLAALEALGSVDGQPLRIAVIGERFIQRIGVSLPIMTYARHLAATGGGDVRLLDITHFNSAAAMLAEIHDDEIVIVNGMGPLWIAPWLGDAIATVRARGRTVFVYAHETQAVIEREHAARPEEHAAALETLRGCVVLCVSDRQQRLMKELGVAATAVIYNTGPGLVHRPETVSPRREASRVRVVMVGSVQARKGVELFSRVAELARQRELAIDFEWVGGGTPEPGIFVSDAVTWSGHLPRAGVERVLRMADVLLLSSVDDPMPLAALEAVGMRRRVVAYQGVGSAEVLAGVGGFRSFETYDPSAALEAVVGVLGDELDDAAYAAVLEVFTVEAFAERMSLVLRARTPRVNAPPAGSAGPVAPELITRQLARGDFDGARVLTRQALRAEPSEAELANLSRAWLAAGERPYAIALARVSALIGSVPLAPARAADFADVGLSPGEIDRWTARNATARAWGRYRRRPTSR